MYFERTVKEIRGDYAVLVGASGVETEVALALLPDGLRQRAYQRYLRHDDMPETPWAGTLTDHNSEE